MSLMKDQLLKAGLIDAKKARKAAQEKRKAQKRQKNTREVVVDEAKIAADKVRQEKLERDRKLNHERKMAAEAKAVAAQIKQLIQMNRQQKGDGDDVVAYNFTESTKVKKVNVSPEIREHLVSGRLAIVKLGAGYELVPAPVADKIAQRDETVVVSRQDSCAAPEDDGLYQDHQIPDDLMW